MPPETKAFQDRFRIVLFDHVGCGGSDFSAYSPHRYRSIHGYAEELLELCEELDLSDCSLVGHSFSGMVGVVAALANPRRCLLDDPDTGYVGGFSRPELDAFFEAMSANYYAWASGFAPLAMGNPDRPELAQEFARTLSGMRPDIALAIARMVFQYDHRGDLPRLKVPTLIVHSGEDLAVPNEVGNFLARNIPDSKLSVIDARGHLPHLSSPAAVNRVLGTYLAAAA